MCLFTQKKLFCSNGLMRFIVYLCAINTTKVVAFFFLIETKKKKINIINGINGSSLENLKKYDKIKEKLNKMDFFLDNVTGDLY